MPSLLHLLGGAVFHFTIRVLLFFRAFGLCCFSLLLVDGTAFPYTPFECCCFPPSPFLGGAAFVSPPLSGPAFSLPPCGWCCFRLLFLLGGGAFTPRSFRVVLLGLRLLLLVVLPSSTTFGWCCRSPFFGMK